MNKDNKINSFVRVLGYFIVTPIIFAVVMTVILNIFKTQIFTENVLYIFASIGFVLGLVLSFCTIRILFKNNSPEKILLILFCFFLCQIIICVGIMYRELNSVSFSIDEMKQSNDYMIKKLLHGSYYDSIYGGDYWNEVARMIQYIFIYSISAYDVGAMIGIYISILTLYNKSKKKLINNSTIEENPINSDFLNRKIRIYMFLMLIAFLAGSLVIIWLMQTHYSIENLNILTDNKQVVLDDEQSNLNDIINKISENLYYVLDYSESFWEYKPVNAEQMREKYNLVKDEIDNYIQESKEFANNHLNDSIIIYIRISNKFDNYVKLNNNIKDSYYRFFEKTETYDETEDYEIDNVTLYCARFMTNDEIGSLGNAVLGYIRNKTTYDGNGGVFPRHDGDEIIHFYEPYYEKEVTASGKLVQYVFDKESKNLLIYEREYPGER